MEHNGEYYFTLALEQLRNGDGNAALPNIDKAIQLEPQNPEYYLKRGFLRHEFGEYLSALEDYAKVIAFSSDIRDLGEAYSRRAITHEYLGRVDELLKDLDWLIEHDPGDAQAYSWRGYYKQRAMQFEGALKDFDMAYQLSPTDNNLLMRAQAYYALGCYEEALQDLTNIITLKEHHPNYLADIYRWRGSTYYKLDKFADALVDFNEEARLRGDDLFLDVNDYIDKFGLAG